ncbi:Helix-turn-helix [Mariniphaga anaerophila]|uniref:Helix-turn-helix n=1 Tax=Mariniphaga anaerophila TaxID=1484053 RepID=A0A1M5ETP3_9BACT|nr:AAA family ATPase [Mariniphaga anaerophila]SHF82451.1 Helix-turn-helix [Mariniphaga anaerophila]
MDKVISATDLLNMEYTEIPYLLESVFPKQGLAAVGGSSDTGKSHLLRQVAMSIVSGEKEFLGLKLNSEHNRVLYVSTEDFEIATSVSLKKQQAELGLTNETFKNLSFIFDTTDLIANIESQLQQNPHDLVVIDTFSDLFGNDINQVNQVRNYLHQYGQLANKYKCLFLFIHHSGKGTEYKTPSKNSLLGSQGFEGKMRAVVLLLKSKSDVNLRYFCSVKGNYIEEKMKTEAIELVFNDNLCFQATGNTNLLEEIKKPEKENTKSEVLKLQQSGFSQGEIADRLGISQPSVSRILSGKS